MPLPAAALDSDTFRRVCSKFATGVIVATVAGPDGRPYGITVNSFTSVSCLPPLVLICIDYRSSILPHFRASSYFGINVLREEQQDLSVRFAQRDLDGFVGLEWFPGNFGVPLLDGVLAQMECSVSQTIEAGDHAIFIGEVLSAKCHEGDPLLFFGSSYGRCAR